MPEINHLGPKCEWCSCRPDDPMWVQSRGQDKGLACLGCIADLRMLGAQLRVLGRAIFTREGE